MSDIKRIVDAAANAKLDGKMDNFAKIRIIIQSYSGTIESFTRLEEELRNCDQGGSLIKEIVAVKSPPKE